ncbi:MAG: PEP-CTERM sorting domain-containing protein [Tepidisphaeraceae bacterium]
MTIDGGNYLSINCTSAAGAASTGNVRRTFVKGASGIDTSQTIEYAWDFRLDSPTSSRTVAADFVTFLDNGDLNTGANQTWNITSSGATGKWTFNNGNRDGSAVTGVDSGITVVTGQVYHFNVVLYDGPTAAMTSWDATISYTDETGPHSVTQTNLAFRSAAIVPSGQFQLYAGAAAGKQVAYSFDSLSVSNVPEPATLGLMAFGSVGLLRRQRRHRS